MIKQKILDILYNNHLYTPDDYEKAASDIWMLCKDDKVDILKCVFIALNENGKKERI